METTRGRTLLENGRRDLETSSVLSEPKKIKAPHAQSEAERTVYDVGHLPATPLWKNPTQAMDFADRVRTVAAKRKGATDDIASSVIDFVKNLSVEKIRLACDDEPSIMSAAGTAREKCQSLVVIETTPRHISASNGLTKTTVTSTSEQLRTLRHNVPHRYKA